MDSAIVQEVRSPRRIAPASMSNYTAFRMQTEIMDIVPHHMFLLDPDFSAQVENRAACEYLGRSCASSARERIAEVTHPDDLERILAMYESAMASGAAVSEEGRVRRKDGQYRWFHLRLYPLRDEMGSIARWCGTRIDIDDERRPEPALETVELAAEIDRAAIFEEIVGTSAALQQALSRIARIAGTDSTVLISGETGTGKELAARAIHNWSSRAARPFVSVNCAAIPKDLIALELLGSDTRRGHLEIAEGGTIFLDDIGELPAEMQAAFLRVLQCGEYQRVDGGDPIRCNVRILASTHRDLKPAIAAGAFRRDLYERINVFAVQLPPLRERREDIRLLVEYFIGHYAGKMGKKFRRMDTRSLDRLASYSWPGNIRELQNLIEHSMIVCDNEVFSVAPGWLWRGLRRSKNYTL